MVDRRRLAHVLAGPLAGLAGQLLLLAALAATTGLGVAGWLAGIAGGLAVDAALGRALIRDRGARLGPAGGITLARASLAVGVAALTADSFAADVPAALLVSLATAALVLDYADGRIARRTGTESALGGRFDGEVDAFLILALSAYLVPANGWWVLLIGAARYLFLAAGWWLAWMRAPLPPRDWRKTVTAATGITLTVAAAGVLPVWLTQAGLTAALALIAESFGRDVIWLWQRRDQAVRPAPQPPRRRGPVRTGLSVTFTVLAVVIVWAALVAPNDPRLAGAGTFLRLPIEGVAVIALAALLPDAPRRLLAWLAGATLGLLLLVKILDLGFFTAFDRPFNPVDDWSYAPIGVETLRDSIGRRSANLALAGAAVVGVLALVLPTLATVRLSRVAAGHRRTSLQALGGLAAVWALCWAFGVQVVSHSPIASTSAAELAVQEVRTVQNGIRDRARFAQEIRHDRYRYTPGDQLLTGLRGKDVLFVFVESYGRVAVQGSTFSPGVDRVLDAGTARSGGGLPCPQRLPDVADLRRHQLAGALDAAVGAVGRQPAALRRAGRQATASRSARRSGAPAGGRSTTCRRTTATGRRARLLPLRQDLRPPQRRLPRARPTATPRCPTSTCCGAAAAGAGGATARRCSPRSTWCRATSRGSRSRRWSPGTGSATARSSTHATSRVDMIGNTDVKQAAYGRSIQYTLSAIVSFVQHYGNKNLVLVMLGDHQPAKIVSGENATHEVPISIISHDPAVLRRISSWGWNDGLQPAQQAPVWPMSAFRDRFLAAYGSHPTG